MEWIRYLFDAAPAVTFVVLWMAVTNQAQLYKLGERIRKLEKRQASGQAAD